MAQLGWRILVCLLAAAAVGQAAPGSERDLWLFLRDKPNDAGGRLVWSPPESLVDNSLLGRDVDAEYVRQIEATGVAVGSRSRWFNAVTVRVTPAQERQLRALPFVRETRPVGRWRRIHPPDTSEPPPAAAPKPSYEWADYGASFDQLSAIGVTFLHDQALRGQGVKIAVLDAGFNYRHHRAFAGLRVVAERDFVNGDGYVSDEDDEPTTGDEGVSDQNHHGARVLSVLGGELTGRLIGVAPEAEYILAKTEDVATELAVEERRWIAGLEWADSLGADIVSTSVGYTVFDDGTGYTYDDLDGHTALTTRAAELAVERGIVVVAAAGNEGSDPWHHVTVPADGEGVLSVGAVDGWRGGDLSSIRLAGFSSRGPTADGRIKPDVVAPGVGIFVVDGQASVDGEAFSRDEYEWVRGTSFAAPLVSGVCALLKQMNPAWTPAEISDALRQSARDVGPAGADTLFGWGLVDAAAAGLSLDPPEASTAGDPFPNPLVTGGGSETIYFPLRLSVQGRAGLDIFDLCGALVAHLERGPLVAGNHTTRERALDWPVPDDVAGGIYFYRLRAGSLTSTGKVAIVRRP